MELVQIQMELVPLLERLELALVGEREDRAESFFREIRVSIASARSNDELMPAFRKLSTSCFQGFSLGPSAFETLNVVLERAEGVAALLALPNETLH